MNFVLQLESVAGEDDKAQIHKLWEKQLSLITMLKESKVYSRDTDSENEDEDNFVWIDRSKNRIKQIIEEFEERWNNFVKH